ncbi:MAG: hypothetical protein KAT79_06165, partial [candidate division Zixibacteria bacterium]|nr:hypothetical protein [candidate division Zixibacteria bacterium]
SAILILVLYGKDFMAAFSYVGEQSLALHGLPFGLTSPWAFLERLISYGFSNHLFYLDPDLWLLTIVGGILFVVAGGTRALKERSRAYRLALFWAVIGIVGLSPLNYSPIRYATLIIPGIILFGILAFETALTVRRPTKMQLGRGDLVVLLFVFWFAMYHFVGNLVYFNQIVDRWLVWGLLMGAIPAAYGMLYLLKKRGGLISSRMLLTGLTVVLALSLTTNTFRNRRLHFQDHNFNIAEANADIAQIIGDDAVVSGSYGPAITVGTNLRSFIHMFGVTQLDSTLFDRQPVTHLALDDDNLDEALRSYSELADLPAIATYYVRDYRVRLFNISQVFANHQAHTYQPSIYEQALTCYNNEQFDSAFVLANRFQSMYPDSKSGGLLMCDLLSRRELVDDAYRLFVRLADLYPTDFYIQMQCGRFIQMMALTSGNNDLASLARNYYDRGMRVNRFRGDYAGRLYSETARQFR